MGGEVTELSGPLSEFLAQAIPQEAGSVHKSYTLVPTEDLEQQMWMAVLERRDDFERLIEQGAYGVARHRLKEGAWRLVWDDDRYRRAVKAASEGYERHDEQFYTVGVLKKLIPMWLDNGLTERPPKGRELRVGKVASASDSDYKAMMLDLDRALAAVKPYHSKILMRYYVYPQGSGGWKHSEIASDLGIPSEALRKRIYRALRAVVKQLGGKNPWPSRTGLEYQGFSDTAA
jgi:DNA-directed RNA polymerase specialized sigma24 family protein